VSAFYVSNRKDGFVLSGSILAKSKFYGNSLSAILDGVGRLVFLKRGEEYLLTMPYAHCKGNKIFADILKSVTNSIFIVIHNTSALFNVILFSEKLNDFTLSKVYVDLYSA